MYAAGHFDPAIEKAIATAFERWEPGPEQRYPPVKPAAERSLVTADRPGAAHSTIRLGLPAPDPTHKDYIPMQVTDGLLGGTFVSRITTNIREQKGYTYSPFSRIATFFHEGFWVEPVVNFRLK